MSEAEIMGMGEVLGWGGSGRERAADRPRGPTHMTAAGGEPSPGWDSGAGQGGDPRAGPPMCRPRPKSITHLGPAVLNRMQPMVGNSLSLWLSWDWAASNRLRLETQRRGLENPNCSHHWPFNCICFLL